MRGPPPDMRRAALQGSPDRKHKPPGLNCKEYADGEIVSRVAVCNGRILLGHILGISAGSYQAVAPNGLLIGSYASRPEAARAFHQVRP
jgi:hypothetical protein